MDAPQLTGSEIRSPPHSSRVSSPAFEQYRAYDRTGMYSPKQAASDIQPLPHSSNAMSILDLLPERPVEQSPTVGMASGLNTSDESGLPTDHLGELGKHYPQLANELRRFRKGKAKDALEPPEPAKLEMTDHIKMPKIGTSSAPLSTPLRELEQGMIKIKARVKELGPIDPKSLVEAINRWENNVRAIAQSFEAAELQRIKEISAALCHDEEFERHRESQFQSVIAYELKKKDKEWNLKFQQQKKELEAGSETKTAVWKSGTPESIEQGAKTKYGQQVKHHVQGKGEETKQNPEKQKVYSEAEFEEKLEALEQEHEKKQSEYVVTATQQLPSPPSSIETRVESAVSGSENVPVSPLQSTQPRASLLLVGEERESKPLSNTASPEAKRTPLKEDEKGDAVDVGYSTPANIKVLAATDMASLKRKYCAIDDDNDSKESATVSLKRPCMTVMSSKLYPKTPQPIVSAPQPQTIASGTIPSVSPEDVSIDIPELDPELEYELFGSNDFTTLQPEDAPTDISDPHSEPATLLKRKRSVVDDDDDKDDEPISTPHKKPRTNAPSTSTTSNVAKIEGLFSTSYIGLPRWKTTQAEMSEGETREFTPLYNPPPPPTTYGGLPQWTTVEEDGDDEEL